MSIVLKGGRIFEELATSENGELDMEYIDSIQSGTDFAKLQALKNIPSIQSMGELLEYLVSVKRNEHANVNEEGRVSKSQWESIFVAPDFIDIMFHVNQQLRQHQYDRIKDGYKHIFNSMSKFQM